MGIFASKLEAILKSFEDEPVRVLMLGLDAAGKTTILYKLKLDKIVKTIPTIGFNVETISPCKGLTFTVWDVGGQTKLRRLWKHYYQEAGGLIYVIDSADPSRFKEAHEELFAILSDEQMLDVPVLVLANKQDMACAESEENIIKEVGLADLSAKHMWYIQSCSAIKGDGILEGLQAFARMVKDFKKSKK